MIQPLNGTRTHPLTKHARGELERIAASPVPRQEVNPGCANRLLRGGLVTQIMRPSPYASHKGAPLAHLQITDAGRLELPGAEGTRARCAAVKAGRVRPDTNLLDAPKSVRRFPYALKGALASSVKQRAKANR